MRGILRSAIALMFVVGLGISSQAQSNPPGSYQQTCRNIDFHDNVLAANCQDSTGRWQSALLRDVQSCRSDIINDEGALRCGKSSGVAAGLQGGYASPVGGFSGPYTQSCKDIKSHGDDLEARCQTRNGDWHKTKLDDFQKCRGQIINEDGNLKCVAGGYGGVGRGAYQGNWPAGSYTQSCDGIRVDGDDLKAHCQTRDGGSRDAKLDDFQKCKSDIINDDGKLHCER